jgi:hypothetical protein
MALLPEERKIYSYTTTVLVVYLHRHGRFFCFFGPINSILIKSWGDMDVVSSALVFFVVRLALCEFFWC